MKVAIVKNKLQPLSYSSVNTFGYSYFFRSHACNHKIFEKMGFCSSELTQALEQIGNQIHRICLHSLKETIHPSVPIQPESSLLRI